VDNAELMWHKISNLRQENKETPTLALEKNAAVVAEKNTQERSVLLEMHSATTVSIKVTTVQCAIAEMF